MPSQDETNNINEDTTVNELADIILQLEQSLTIRIYDDLNEVIGAIRLVHVDEIQQIDQLRAYQHAHKAYLH